MSYNLAESIIEEAALASLSKIGCSATFPTVQRMENQNTCL